jgi:hypothetical protein
VGDDVITLLAYTGSTKPSQGGAVQLRIQFEPQNDCQSLHNTPILIGVPITSQAHPSNVSTTLHLVGISQELRVKLLQLYTHLHPALLYEVCKYTQLRHKVSAEQQELMLCTNLNDSALKTL